MSKPERLEPPAGFKVAFQKVFGVPCTPSAYIWAVRNDYERIQEAKRLYGRMRVVPKDES